MLCGAFWDNLGVVLLAVQGNILLSTTCIKYALHSHCSIPWICIGTFYCDKNQYGAVPHNFSLFVTQQSGSPVPTAVILSLRAHLGQWAVISQ